MIGGKWIACAVGAFVALVLVGCGNTEDGVRTHGVRHVVIVAPGAASDIGWNEQGIVEAQRLSRHAGLQLKVEPGVSAGAVSAQLERASSGGAQLVIAHGREAAYATAASAVAARTHVPELVFGRAERVRAGLVGDVEVATQEGGYLAGYISARASFVQSVGIVVAADEPAWYRTAGGFIAGARRFDPHVKIQYIRVGPASNDDVAASQRAAEQEIRHGAQMVLGLGDRSTLGVMRSTLNALKGIHQRRFDAMLVDVIGDKSGSGHLSITGLTAVRWSFEPAYRQAIADLRAGRFGRHPYTLDLANGGISVIKDGRTPVDNYEAALRLGRQIEQGKLSVPNTTTDAAVRQLLAEAPRS